MKIHSNVILNKYPRLKILPDSREEGALIKAFECINAAAKRKPVSQTVEGKPGIIRFTCLTDKVPFINIFSVNDPFLAVYPSSIKAPKGEMICDPACGDGDLIDTIRNFFPDLNIVGGELNEKMYQRAKELNPSIPIHLEDARYLSYLKPKTVSLFIFSGLLNQSIVTKEEGREILLQAILRSKDYSYMIISGKSAPLFELEDLIKFGLYPLLSTKWSKFVFFPFYLCLTPRKIENGEGSYTIMPLINDISGKETGEGSFFEL